MVEEKYRLRELQVSRLRELQVSAYLLTVVNPCCLAFALDGQMASPKADFDREMCRRRIWLVEWLNLDG